MQKFTPGPWGTLEGRIVGRAGSTVASVNDRGVAFAEQDEANARLISAAPDLLEALDWALTYGEFECAVDNPLHAAAMDRARAALTKASA